MEELTQGATEGDVGRGGRRSWWSEQRGGRASRGEAERAEGLGRGSGGRAAGGWGYKGGELQTGVLLDLVLFLEKYKTS
jgi:hypothetical protein